VRTKYKPRAYLVSTNELVRDEILRKGWLKHDLIGYYAFILGPYRLFDPPPCPPPGVSFIDGVEEIKKGRGKDWVLRAYNPQKGKEKCGRKLYVMLITKNFQRIRTKLWKPSILGYMSTEHISISYKPHHHLDLVELPDNFSKKLDLFFRNTLINKYMKGSGIVFSHEISTYISIVLSKTFGWI